VCASSALTLLIRHQEQHQACKNTAAAIFKGVLDTFGEPLANPGKPTVHSVTRHSAAVLLQFTLNVLLRAAFSAVNYLTAIGVAITAQMTWVFVTLQFW